MKSKRLLAIGLLAVLASSCAYYNTFYSVRKYYNHATLGEPYVADPTPGPQTQDFAKSIDYSKKLLSNYPKSKWVDDAYLMWARSLLGQSDPLQTIKMLEEFPDRFPKSPIKDDAHFYLGVAYRQARKYRQAVRTFDEFLEHAPKHELAPYAYIERSRALRSLEEPAEAAASASKVIERFPKSKLADRARIARADALFEAKQYGPAREDYREMGRRSQNDDDRLKYLLREVDCLEAARNYDDGLAILRDAISHEHEPLPPDTTGGRVAIVQQTPGYDRYGRLVIRSGTVHLHAGRLPDALAAYQRVVRDYPRDPLATEAQFRVGYAYETLGDDFDRARTEYQQVKDVLGQGGFGAQAADRLHNLDRIAQFRSAGGDTETKQVESAFLVAEQYLFELDKPDRALEEYHKIAERYLGKPAAAKAIDAEAWVLSRKLNRKAEADTLFWHVVRYYPKTEGQVAARDYLEMSGQQVPAELIKLPEPPPKPVVPLDTTLTAPPDSTPPLGTPFGPQLPDSLRLSPPRKPSFLPSDRGPTGAPQVEIRQLSPPDTTRRSTSPPDTTRRSSSPADTTRRSSSPPDTTLRRPSPRDTSGGHR